MDAKIIKVLHVINGEIEVKAKFAEVALKYNHVKDGGSYCSLDDAYLYFEEYAPKKEEPKPKRGGRRKKAEPKPEVEEESQATE